MDLEFQAVTEKEKEKTDTKIAWLDCKPAKTKYSVGAGSFVHFWIKWR